MDSFKNLSVFVHSFLFIYYQTAEILEKTLDHRPQNSASMHEF